MRRIKHPGLLASILILALTPWPGPLEAQDARQYVEGSLGSPYLLRTWSRTSGMPHGTVTAIAQSPDGYLWLATFDGLARFDGQSFRTYDLSDGLASNRISSLLVDSQGRLWVGHEIEGLSVMTESGFTSYGVEQGLPSGSIWEMVELEGTILLAMDDGLFSLDLDDASFRPEERSGAMLDLMLETNGDLWLAGENGLTRRRSGGQTFESIEAPPGLISSITEDRQGHLWITSGVGLWRDDGDGADRSWRLVFEAECPDKPASLATVISGPDGDLWFRPCTTALLASDTHLYRLPASRLSANRPARGAVMANFEELQLDGVPVTSALHAAEQGGLWLGTYGRGIGALIPRRIWRWPVAEAFEIQELRAMVGDGQGGLWISGNCGAPLIHFREGRFTAPPLFPSEDKDCIGGLTLDEQGDLWVGSSSDLLRIRPDGSVFRRTLIHGEDREIYSVLKGRDGEVWAGLAGHGLARLMGDDPEHIDIGSYEVSYFTRSDGLASDHVHSLLQDRHGDLWIGTHQGLSHYRDGVIRSYREADGMLPGMVRVIYEDAHGVLWIGTYGGGLARFEDGQFTRYTADQGLYENVVTHLIEDRHGRFWMLGNRGLYFHPREQLEAFAAGEIDELKSVFFDESDGMIEGSGGRQPSGWQMDDGRLFFATVDGLAMIDSEAIDIEEEPPSIHIDELRIEGRRVAISEDRPVVIEPGQHDLEVHYTSPGSFDAEKTRFRYRLEGHDERWSEVDGRRTAYFTHIPPGTYSFRVSAANRFGRWNEDGATLRIIVEAPWWQTTTAYGLYLLSAVCLLWLYVRRQRLRIQYGEKLLAERTQQLHQLADLLSICANCKKVRGDEGLWEQIEVFFANHSNLQFSHGLCPDCTREMLEEIESP